jgi:hypothetical protein
MTIAVWFLRAVAFFFTAILLLFFSNYKISAADAAT